MNILVLNSGSSSVKYQMIDTRSTCYYILIKRSQRYQKDLTDFNKVDECITKETKMLDGLSRDRILPRLPLFAKPLIPRW